MLARSQRSEERLAPESTQHGAVAQLHPPRDETPTPLERDRVSSSEGSLRDVGGSLGAAAQTGLTAQPLRRGRGLRGSPAGAFACSSIAARRRTTAAGTNLAQHAVAEGGAKQKEGAPHLEVIGVGQMGVVRLGHIDGSGPRCLYEMRFYDDVRAASHTTRALNVEWLYDPA